MSVLERVKKRDSIKAGTNSRCPYRDVPVCLIEVSIMRELTKCMLGTGPNCLS